MDYEGWYQRALQSISTLDEGKTFETKDLFKGTEWESLSNGDRRSFGRYFSSKVKDGELENIVKIGEGKTHHNKYRKQ